MEAIGRVTAEVAHDFNNVLAAVVGFAGLGRAQAVDEKTTHFFDQICKAGAMAVELTSQLTAFSRKQDLSAVAIDLNDALTNIYPMLRQLVPKRIELQLALSPTPVEVFVDKTQLERVIINLLVNSRDAIADTGSITLHTSTESPPGITHGPRTPVGWLRVSDTGSGIPPDALAHIFEPFFTTKPSDHGTGLGLAAIHGIVSQSGGDIFVDSTPGLGTTMTIALPTSIPSTTSHNEAQGRTASATRLPALRRATEDRCARPRGAGMLVAVGVELATHPRESVLPSRMNVSCWGYRPIPEPGSACAGEVRGEATANEVHEPALAHVGPDAMPYDEMIAWIFDDVDGYRIQWK